MNPSIHTFVHLLLLAPLGSQALEVREHPVQSMVIVPVDGGGDGNAPERQSVPALRESLRQSPGSTEPEFKPFRLSPEERMRLREQLRKQMNGEADARD